MDYNVKILKYANNKQQIRFYSVPVHISEKINKYTSTVVEQKNKESEPFEENETENLHSIINSRNRTIKNMYNIVRSNNWEWFCTFTFDPYKVNSTNYDSVMHEIGDYFHKLKKKFPDMIYFYVPELHKDKKKYHIHGFISNLPEDCFIYSGKYKGKNGIDEDVYKLWNYRLGWNYHTRVRDNNKVVNYVTKYITKYLCDSTKNKRRFNYSMNCNKPIEINVKVKNLEKLWDSIKDNVTYSKTVEYFDSRVLYFETSQLEKWLSFENVDNLDREFKHTSRKFDDM